MEIGTYALRALIAATIGVGICLYAFPEPTVRTISNGFNTAAAARDQAIITLDHDNDGCVSLSDAALCVSVGAYLKSIISEEALSPEEARNLPSFIGEPYPAPPFINRI